MAGKKRKTRRDCRAGISSEKKPERMDQIIRKYTSHKEMKADEYRYWQSRPVHERMNAVSELTTVAYALGPTIRSSGSGQLAATMCNTTDEHYFGA